MVLRGLDLPESTQNSEAFEMIPASMILQHTKWLEEAVSLSWREPIASLNGMSRYHLAMDALMYIDPECRAKDSAPTLISELEDSISRTRPISARSGFGAREPPGLNCPRHPGRVLLFDVGFALGSDRVRKLLRRR